jgi:hypothetical protein
VYQHDVAQACGVPPCVNILKSAVFRSIQECGQFFDEEARELSLQRKARTIQCLTSGHKADEKRM